MLGIGLGGWVVPSGMLEDAGQGHIPESLPRPRWVGQHTCKHTLPPFTCKHTLPPYTGKHTVPPFTALPLHTCTTALH